MFASGGSLESSQLELRLMLEDDEVADAIVAHVWAKRRRIKRTGSPERYFGIVVSLLGLMCIWAMTYVAHRLYEWLANAGSDPIPPMAVAIGQLLLLRLSWSMLKACGIWLADSLNLASYPTTLHVPTVTTSHEDRIRYLRIKHLIADLVLALAHRQKMASLHEELTRVEFTRPASVWILVQAQLGLWIRANLPPYNDRGRAYLLAGTAATACLAGIWFCHSRIGSQAQMTYLATWSTLFSLEFLKQPRKATVPETV